MDGDLNPSRKNPCVVFQDKIAPAFVAAFAEIEAAEKNATNPHLKNTYADLQAVISVARPALAKHKIAFFQTVIRREGLIGVRTVLIHESGQQIDGGETLLEIAPGRNQSQCAGATISYARRYSLAALLGIYQADPDASVEPPRAYSPPPAAPKKAPPKPKPAPKRPAKKALTKEERIHGATVDQIDRYLKGQGKAETWATLTPEKRAKLETWLEKNAGKLPK